MAEFNKKSELRGKIEKESSPDTEIVIENDFQDFIVDLFKTMEQGVKLPALDLKSPEAAQATSKELVKTLGNLKRYQHQVRSLKSVLEKRRWELEESGSD